MSDNPYQSPQSDSRPSRLPLGNRPTNVRWLVFALSFGTSWLLYIHRYAFSFIMPKLKEEWGLRTDQLGWIDSAFQMSYAACQVPMGIAADALGVRFILPILIIVWSIGLAMQAWAPNQTMLGVARLTLGAGQSAVFGNLSRISSTWFAAPVRTTLQGLTGVLAGRLGGMCAALIFGTLLLGVMKLDWRTAVYLMAGVGVIHAILFRFVFRDTPREHPKVNEAEAKMLEEGPAAAKKDKMSPRQMIRASSPRRVLNLFAVNLQSILSVISDSIYSSWIPLFVFEVYSMNYKEMGLYSALPLLGGALGGFLGGVLNDWLIKKTGNRRWSRSGVAFVGKGMAAVLLFTALVFYDSPFIFCGMLFFVKLFGDWSLVTVWGVITDIGGRATASIFSFNNAVAIACGISAPILFGYIAEYHGWRAVFVTAASLYVACACSWLLINCTIKLIAEDGDEAAQG
ncbi:MAG: MFS transporter [Verrucomicrobiota bacterium]